MTFELSDGQAEACDKLERWWHGDPVRHPFRLNGYAGTGKTTVVEYFLQRLGLPMDQVRLLAPTGKAARVLSHRAGFPATTIHRELYQPYETDEVVALRKELKEAKTDEEAQTIRRKLAKYERKGGGVGFSMKATQTEAQLFVIDEASMVDDRLADDLRALNVPLLLLGDPGQLPPVKGQAGFPDVKAAVTLTEIQRQDEGSAILEAADLVRRGEELPDTCDWGTFRRVRPKELDDGTYADFDVLLCGTHKVRKAFNRRLRRVNLGDDFDDQAIDGWMPRKGDRLVCRANDYRRGLLNGQLLTATADSHEEDDLRVAVDALDDDGVDRHGELSSSLRFKDHYHKDVAVHRVDRTVELDYAYALTVHSAQGSEWDRVVILNDWPGNKKRQWLYTALTRGAQEVVLVG